MIYFIQAEKGTPIKIGYTSGSPYKRLKELQTGHPSTLNILASIDGGMNTEKALHKTFENQRLRGEWFSPSADLLSFINSKSATLDLVDAVAASSMAGLSVTAFNDLVEHSDSISPVRTMAGKLLFRIQDVIKLNPRVS